MSSFKIVFIHGYEGTLLTDWYPEVTRSLDELGVDYAVPDLPGGDRPHAKKWIEAVDDEVIKSDKPIVLVGHSLGSRTALLYLEQYRQSVKAVFLVAAFGNRVENAERHSGVSYPDFFEHEIDIDAVKKLCSRFVVLHSLDDDVIDYEQGREIARDLGARLVTLDGRKHMSSPADAPYVMKELRDELGF